MTESTSDRFELQNDPPKKSPWTPPPAEPVRQKVLFAGLDCLSGQRDLFSTDGDGEPER